MVALKDLIPERFGDNIVLKIDTDDGLVRIKMDDEWVLDTTQGNGKVILLALIHIYGPKFVKQLMRAKINWEEEE